MYGRMQSLIVAVSAVVIAAILTIALIAEARAGLD